MCTTGGLWVFFSLVMVPKTCSLPPYFWLNCYSVFSLQNTKGLPIEIMTYSVGNCIYDRLLWENVNIYHLVHATFIVYKVCPRLSIWCIKIFFGDFKKQQSVLGLKDWLCTYQFWKSLSLSHSAELCIHFYCLTRMRQASRRKTIQSSALRLRHFKIDTKTLIKC